LKGRSISCSMQCVGQTVFSGSSEAAEGGE